MPRKTDSKNPADWLWIAAIDLTVIELAVSQEIGFPTVRSKLAEVLEKTIKAELLRLGWRLEKTHDLNRLALALRRHGGCRAKGSQQRRAAAQARSGRPCFPSLRLVVQRATSQ